MLSAEKILDRIEGDALASLTVIQKKAGFLCQIQNGKGVLQGTDDLFFFIGFEDIVESAHFIPLKYKFRINRNKNDDGRSVEPANPSCCIDPVYVVQFDI